MADERAYNDPYGGSPSEIGSQMNTFFWQKKALIEAKKEMYFGQLSSVTNMPKHYGKTIKKYHYLPLLDDANINDQGIDANGVSTVRSVSIEVTREDGSIPNIPNHGRSVGNKHYFIGEGANDAAAADAAIDALIEWAEASTAGGGLGLTLVGVDDDAKFANAINSSDGQAYALGFRFGGHESAATIDALGVPESGNLYGSSKDVGTIAAKMPALTEYGGRVNRVGFKRVELEGSIEKFGFFDEYTQESLDFDSDADLEAHITREMVRGANEITEDALQIDLLNAAGVVRFGGSAQATNEVSGNSGSESLVTYTDLMKLDIELDNNRCPKHTTLITGTRRVDTRTVPGARYMMIGSELQPMIKRMQDPFSNQAFISVEKYAAAGTVANGEIGMVDSFKFIVVPEMMHWAGAGATVGTNAGYRESGGSYDVYPMLVVGDESFVNIGFQTDGKTVKFKIYNKKPGEGTADRNDPYGEMGFSSIKWYYGILILRPERIALIKTVAEW